MKKKSTASEIYEIPLSITNIRLEFHNERRQRPKEKKIFEKMKAKNFHNLIKQTNLNSQ